MRGMVPRPPATRGEPVLAYYWSPTWVLGAYDMIMLSEPGYSAEDWTALAKDPAHAHAVAYPKVEVWIGANARFAESAPNIVAFLRTYRTSAALVSDALAFMHENNADDAAAARRFLNDHAELWPAWVPGDVAAKVRAALASPE